MNPRLAEVEQALFTYRSLTPAGADTPELWELTQQVDAACDAWFSSPTKYSDVLRVLPDLIVSSEQARSWARALIRGVPAGLRGLPTGAAGAEAPGRVDLGGLLADRTMRYAEETDDPLLIGAAAWNLGLAMLADDMPTGALEVAARGSKSLEPLLAEGTPAHFSVYGGLLQLAGASPA